MIAVVKAARAYSHQWQQQGHHTDHPQDIAATFRLAVMKSVMIAKSAMRIPVAIMVSPPTVVAFIMVVTRVTGPMTITVPI